MGQHLSCMRIIVLDDGSTDGASKLLETYTHEHFPTLRVLRHVDMGYDITRVVTNWNECLAEAEREELDRTAEFTFITADDCVYPPDYVGTIVDRMNHEPLLVVASGTRGIPVPLDGWKPPEGSGRLIRNSLLRSAGFRFPEKIGYESWIVYEAMRRGLKVECINELRYEHIERFGRGHGFVEWGYMPHALGYHPIFFVARCLQNLVSGVVPRITTLGMLTTYVRAFFVRPRTQFYQPHDASLRSFIRSFQMNRMRNIITRFARKNVRRVST